MVFLLDVSKSMYMTAGAGAGSPVLFLLDVSSSMGKAGRLKRSKEVLISLVENLKDNQGFEVGRVRVPFRMHHRLVGSAFSRTADCQHVGTADRLPPLRRVPRVPLGVL